MRDLLFYKTLSVETIQVWNSFTSKLSNDASYFTFEFLVLFHNMSKFDTKSGKRKREKVTGKAKPTETKKVLVWCLKRRGKGRGVKWWV